jgi:hypothetical protein
VRFALTVNLVKHAAYITYMNNTLAFAAFLEKWGEQYASLKITLTRLKEHQDILDKFDIGEIYSADELDIWVEDWLWLQSKFDHPVEIMFFKPYWVPVSKHSYDYFVDLSEGINSIFEADYISQAPCSWAQGYSFPTQFLLNAAPEKLDFWVDTLLLEKEDTEFAYINDFSLKREELAYQGDLEVEPVTFEEVFDTSIELPEDDLIITKPPIAIQDSLITINHVNVLAIGLLPFETKLRHEIDVHDYFGERDESRIKCVRDMVFYLREHGFKGINEFRASIPDTDTEIYYERNCMKITNPSLYLTDRFKLAFEELQNN